VTSTLSRGLASCATVAALALGSSAPALAHCDGHNCHDPNQNGQTSQSSHAQESALTGSALASASQSALDAVPGGTVTKAVTYTSSRFSNAAYKVVVAKANGNRAFVIEDSGFNVLAVRSGHRCGHHHFWSRSHGDHLHHHDVGAHHS
jgi:hypothetical protein